MPPIVPKLHFNAGKETGFAGHLSTFDGSPEPILRELLQNCLDAAHEARRDVCEVSFVLTDVRADDLAGIDDYREKLTCTLEHREGSRQALVTDERRTIGRIKKMLEHPKIPMLLCVDNGIGLDDARMSDLLTEGNSSKSSGGAGSFGIGHLSAFAGSDLRYVLYGSRFGSDTQPGSLFSGHAVLASDLQEDEGGKYHRSADGFLVHPGVQRALFGAADDSEYVTGIPDYIARYMPASRTGTAVAIAGFNYFHEEMTAQELADAVCAVAAANFTCAIADGRMRVDVVDDTSNTARTVKSVDRANVRSILDEAQSTQNGEYFTWTEARRALDAMSDTALELPADEDLQGVRVNVVPLTDGRVDRRVIIYRKGMAITKDMRLWRGKFTASSPFIAAVRLDDGPLEQLVRDSENPQHLKIIKTNLDDTSDQERLKDLLDKIAGVIAEEVRTTDDDPFIPDDIANDLFKTLFTERSARREPEYEDGPDPPRPSPRPPRPVPPPPGPPRPVPPRSVDVPPGGKRIPCASSIGGVDSTGTEVSIAIELLESDKRVKAAGIRLRVCAPTDHTSISAEQPRYLVLRHIESKVPSSRLTTSSENKTEVLWPGVSGERSLTGTLVLDEPYTDDPQLLELEIVKRRPEAAE